ncbi:hypothetical protein SYJ56_24595 [Algoriphagus sp. D3-2-R+10]|uniref:hypothetical protein n=1 Tax=Algoriphagus aurantiacus TaxID=3103948 RepID=UPI002B36D3B1|nr:hypothetical protein [Algoriphagus sp. D3-2-R+10]MEB2778511.1 hypothetical protein [Algoriphagus sp. D3-2-R+10]
MNFLFIFLISVFIIFILIAVLLVNSKNSNNIQRSGNKLTIWHPLKKEVIDLEYDLKSWNVQQVNMLWWGRINSVNLELQSGKWKKVYSRSLSGKIAQLITYLEKKAIERKTDPSR